MDDQQGGHTRTLPCAARRRQMPAGGSQGCTGMLHQLEPAGTPDSRAVSQAMVSPWSAAAAMVSPPWLQRDEILPAFEPAQDTLRSR